MLKRITASLASLAIIAGAALAATLPASAQTAMQDVLCAVGDDGVPTLTCGIETNTLRIEEGDSLAVTVRGAEDVTVAVALFAGTLDGLQRIGDPVEVTVQDGIRGSTVSLPVPVLDDDLLDGNLEGGDNYVVLLADASGDDESPLGREVHILSARASINSAPWGQGSEADPFTVPLVGGIAGDRYELQALVAGTWVSFETVDGDTILSNGSTHLRTVAPTVDVGRYPVRLRNTTQDVTGPEGLYTLYFGVEPTPTPTPDPTPDPTETAPTPGPTDPTTPTEPTPSPTESGPSEDDGDDDGRTGGTGGSGRPGLPSTGVAA